jgi:hypothetical protein
MFSLPDFPDSRPWHSSSAEVVDYRLFSGRKSLGLNKSQAGSPVSAKPAGASQAPVLTEILFKLPANSGVPADSPASTPDDRVKASAVLALTGPVH